MNTALTQRLNQIPDKITTDEFLQNQGLGNEIGFWIFDYDPKAEMEVREYIVFLEETLAKKHSQLKVKHINLLQCMVDYLTERGFIDKAIAMQQKKGDAALLKALAGPLHMDKFAPYLVDSCEAAEQDLVFISGIGSVWPVLRAHNLLNSLHSILGHTPMVLFYPGEYTGQAMSLFGKIPSNNYYRAFKLVP
jgi:BREX protein BrxB